MKIIIDNLAVNYLEQGKGKVVVLLHGWGTNLDDMRGLSQHLSDAFRVISVDLPGFGQSQQPADAWHVGDYSLFVRRLLDKLGISDVYAIVGHSFGGRVTIKGFAQGDLSPRKIILIGSAGIKHTDSARNVGYKIVAKTGKAVMSLPGLNKLSDRAKRTLYKSAGSADYAGAGEMKQIFLNTINEDLSADASKMTVPALLIWGEHDEESPVQDAHQFNRLIKNSTLHIIPQTGHFVHTEAPQAVYKLIDGFLA